ncbi:MAG: UvrD-helicase domain-containing protein [Spirochaetia bacterium]
MSSSKSVNPEETKYLQVLNKEQKQAVLHEGRSLLILAGAGSGKTRVITTKIAYFIDQLGVDPRSILAVTFTNKAADEMHSRVLTMAPNAYGVMVRTFHSFGAWLLRRNAHLLGLNSNFSIYDDDDSLTLLHSLYPSYKRRELSTYNRMISRAKDYALGPEDDISLISTDPHFQEMYARYEARLREIGNADFGDLILRPVELLRSEPEVQRRMHSRFKVILVDEYQDSNVAQYELLKLLYGSQTSLCVVGDDDQSIYRFRGAEVRNIITFPDEFENTTIIRLEQNYRSTERIVSIASHVVNHNRQRLGKTLWTSQGKGVKAKVAFLRNHDEEAEYCARLLEDGNMAGTAILYRTNAQSRSLETCFVKKAIPYKIVGSLRFYDREEVKDALALLSFFVNHNDEVAFRRIVNKPARGIGAKTVSSIIEEAVSEDGDLLAAMQRMAPALSSRSRKGVEEVLSYLQELEKGITEKLLSDFINTAVRKSGILEYHRKQDEIALTQKVANLEELVSAAADYSGGMEGLSRFLEDLELDRSRIAKDDPAALPGVTLITMHNTKGLEFDRVIITGMEDGLFPSRPDEKDDELEEERRIFYVSITRARNELYFTSCRQRMIWGRTNFQMPSRFLNELPEAEVELDSRYSLPGQGIGGTAEYSEEAREWKKGTRVYHDDYGAGVVWKTAHNGSHVVVFVRFETGQTAQFIPEYAPLEKIAEEY